MSSIPAGELELRRQAEDEFSLRRLFNILWFRRRLLIAVTIFVSCVGLIILVQIPPRYTATSVLMVGVPHTQVVDIEAVLGELLSGDSAILGEVEVLRSRGLAAKLIDKFDLRSHDEFNPDLRPPGILTLLDPRRYIPDKWKEVLGLSPEPLAEEERATQLLTAVTDQFLRGLSVNPVHRSNVVRISFESHDPQLSAAVANELPELYITGQLEAKFEATERATKWLNEQLAELKQKVESSEKAVEVYRDRHGLTVANDATILDEQLSEINNQLIIASANRAETEARYRQIEHLLQQDGTRIETASEVLQSTLIQHLREQEASVQLKKSEMSVELGPKHPKMIQVNAEIRDLRGKIRHEIQKIAAGLKNEAEVARIRERSVMDSLRELEKKSGVQKAESVQLRALEREASANRALFETFLGRYKETSTTQGMEQADARIISHAETPFKPSFPNMRITLLVIFGSALLAGIFVACLSEAFHSGLFSPEQVEKELGMSTIGMIPIVAAKDPHDYVLEKPHSNFAEALNSLKTSLLLSTPDKQMKVVQITSSVPEEGKSTLALSLARIVAKSGRKVMLVDGDLRKPILEEKLGISGRTKGLTDFVLSDSGNLSEYVVKDSKSNLSVLPKGGAEYISPIDILSSKRMEAIVDALREHFDLVIFDSPPVMVVSDARILGRLMDKTVFVVRWDKTPKKVALAALKQLRMAEIDMAGVALQQVNLKQYGSYGYGSSGYYYHQSRYGNYYSS